MSKVITSPAIPLPVGAVDAYQIAAAKNITLDEAVKVTEHMDFVGYNDCGEMTFVVRSEADED